LVKYKKYTCCNTYYRRAPVTDRATDDGDNGAREREPLESSSHLGAGLEKAPRCFVSGELVHYLPSDARAVRSQRRDDVRAESDGGWTNAAI